LFELQRTGCPEPIPSRITVHRILVRHGLVEERPRRRRREDYQLLIEVPRTTTKQIARFKARKPETLRRQSLHVDDAAGKAN
jgi:hypothetical protein